MANLEFQKKTVPFYWWGGFLFLLFVTIDQVTKSITPRIFRNDRFAFSLPVPTVLMYLIYFAVLTAIAVHIFKNHQKFTKWIWFAWTLILAGAFSNIGERIILGYVRDFIYITAFHETGIYNLADAYILLGILLLVFMSNSSSSRLTK